ncbi:MAG: hypothetical protein EA384_09795 [Spirochaetaceae bacterium]|nr:MAG: hypothetical protein EA384_09795 [Spirochaetaceae bacterium]
MGREKLFFAVCAAWEVVRFAALFAILTVQPGTAGAAVYTVTALWFGSGQLALAAAMAMLGFFPERYRCYLPLVRLAKLLSFGPAILAVTSGIPVSLDMVSPAAYLVRAVTPLAVLGVDSLLFFFLLSYRITGEE